MAITKRSLLLGTGFLLFLLVLAANIGYYGGASYSGKYCTSCHQIRPSYDRWSHSSHRNMDCKECHGSALTLDPAMHATNLRHLYYQVIGRLPNRVLLKDKQVDAIIENCRRCHMGKFAQWTAGGHSAGYAHIFLEENHNRKTLLMDDCLRCHGMFVEGNISDIVSPIDNRGPWDLVNRDFAYRAVIPCLACHQMHSDGQPQKIPNYLDPKGTGQFRRIAVSSLSFYDRRERRHFPVDMLPMPVMKTHGRAVVLSPDPRQRLCYQCHAPEATLEVATGDDRTAIGVHEGIGCLGCHDPHTLDARASCANCHPRLSNCGLDVAKMDTSFRSQASLHNIHFVSCAECHPKGVPKSKRQREIEQRSTLKISQLLANSHSGL
ncbi:MAG TPA: hypothetical protein VMW38_16900 [Terriglobia bacterium]|nr:hypothetical protein [Terriglobia bacterium]